MSSRPRRTVQIPPAASVLDELYDTSPATDTGPPDDGTVSNTPPPHSGPASNTTRTSVRQTADNRPGGNRTPAGMTRHTIYIAQDTAAQLDAAAARLQTDLGGLVPKHRILAALITAGLGQADAVTAQLRAELLDHLGT